MKIISLVVKDFLSIENINFDFDNKIKVLVGENQTDPGQRSNGSGKTAFVSAIEYGLMHYTSKKTVDKELIRWGQDEFYIGLKIYCPTRNDTLFIERVVNRKQGGSSQLTVNGKLMFSFEDKMVDSIDKYIQNWIGISQSDIQNYFIINKFKYKSFFEASNTSLVQLIGRFSNLSIIDGINKDILKKNDELNTQISNIQLKISNTEGKIEANKISLENEKNIDINELVAEAIEKIEKEIVQLDSLNIQHEDSIINKNELISKLKGDLIESKKSLDNSNARLNSFKEDDFNNLINSLNEELKAEENAKFTQEQKIKSKNKDITEMKKVVNKIDILLSGTITCPKCSHKFILGQDIDIDAELSDKRDTEQIIESLTKAVSLYEQTMLVNIEKIKELNGKKRQQEEEHDKQVRVKNSIQKDIFSINSEINSIKLKIETCENEISSFKQKISQNNELIKQKILSKKDVKPSQFNNDEKIRHFENLIKEGEILIESYLSEIESVKTKISENLYWATVFEKFVQYLSSKVLKTLEGYANHYLKEMKSDLRLQFEKSRIKADGKSSDKITAYVIRDGETHTFFNFSGGEMVKLEAATILAVKKAINSTHKYGGLDFISVDEIFESADDLALSELINSLSVFDQTILITTHVPISNLDCDILKFVKKNRVTELNIN